MKENDSLATIVIGILLIAIIASGVIRHSRKDAAQPTQEPEIVVEPDTLDDWQMLQMAIIMTESKFDPTATGSHRDAGLYQMIPIYVAEVNRLTGADYSHEDAYDMDKAMDMFDIYQSFKNPDHDIDLAIYHHNKATWYKRKVLENYEFVRRYETVRERISDR